MAPTSQPIAAAASSAVRVPPGRRGTAMVSAGSPATSAALRWWRCGSIGPGPEAEGLLGREVLRLVLGDGGREHVGERQARDERRRLGFLGLLVPLARKRTRLRQ